MTPWIVAAIAVAAFIVFILSLCKSASMADDELEALAERTREEEGKK